MSPKIPETQKAIVFYKNGGDLTYEDIKTPKPKPDEILINIKYSGVCHTDLHAWKGDWPLDVKLDPYLVGGHEGAGVVVAIGDNVKGWNLGDYAGIKWLNGSCMNCEECELSHESNCPEADLSGYTHDGSFQQYATGLAVQAAHIPKPEEGSKWYGKDDEYLAEIAPILCAGITVYKALKSSEAKPGQYVAISGAAGGLGSLAVQYAKAMGLVVVGIDGGEGKEELFKKVGGDVFIDFTKEKDVPKKILEVTKGGAHAVINVAVSEAAISQSTQYVRSNGTVVLVGLPANAYCKSNVFDQVVKSYKVVGSYVGNRADTREALDFFERGLVRSPIKIVGLSELPRVFEEMAAGKILGRYVVDTTH